MLYRRFIRTAFLLSLISTTAQGQGSSNLPSSFDTRYVNSHTTLRFQSRFVFGIDATFTNLGELGYPEDTDDDEDGEFIDFLFSDGYIDLASEDTSYTSAFQFQMDNASVDQDGFVDSFNLNRYRSTASDDVFTVDDDISIGWEFAYQHEWGTRHDRLRYGLLAGLAINRFNFGLNETVNGDMYMQTATVTLDGPRISYVESGVYTGSTDGPSINVDEDMSFDTDTESPVVQDVWQVGEVIVPSTVNAFADLDVVLTNFRLGPTIDYRITDRFHVMGSAGLNLTFMHQDITVAQNMDYLLNIGATGSYERNSTTDWLGGYYVEGGFYYYINESTAAYGSISTFKANNPDTQAGEEGVRYNVNLKDNIVFSLGVKLSF